MPLELPNCPPSSWCQLRQGLHPCPHDTGTKHHVNDNVDADLHVSSGDFKATTLFLAPLVVKNNWTLSRNLQSCCLTQPGLLEALLCRTLCPHLCQHVITVVVAALEDITVTVNSKLVGDLLVTTQVNAGTTTRLQAKIAHVWYIGVVLVLARDSRGKSIHIVG